MATNGYGPTAVPGHIGRIPNFGKTQVNPMGSVEPPACIQNAMMTKDKKPFTYTPGGLDLSQIRTPSMARRMARQRSLEEQEQANAGHQGAPNYHPQGGPVPPPPPPLKIPAPPPPPPLFIEAPNSKTTKPVALGERPEIVIPENPIGMLRKTNSPYHWEAEKADMLRQGAVPKFVEKVPSPLTVKLPSQNAPQNYSPQFSNTIQQNQSPGSPLYKPEALYGNKSGSPSVNGSPQTRDILLRQDSQFNKSPQPFANQSPLNNNTPYSPTPNNHWKQPDRRDSPASVNSPQSPNVNRGPFSPNVVQNSPNYQQSPPNTSVFHTLPRAAQKNQDHFINNQNNNDNSIYNNVKESQHSPPTNTQNTTPWRANTLNRLPRENVSYNNNQGPNSQQAYSPPWKSQDSPYKQNDNYNNVRQENRNVSSQQQEYIPPWLVQDNNKVQNNNVPWRSHDTPNRNTPPTSPPENRYQSSISIPVTPRKQAPNPQYNNSPPHKEVVYVNQEPVYFCPDSPKSIPPWVKTQKEKTKTPPPVWCQRPLEGRRSAPRELVTPPRETNQEPEWVKKSNELQRGAREVVSPPKYQQPTQPNWSTLPSENRKSVPKENAPGSRIIPIQMEVSSNETRNHNKQGGHQPQLRIVIDMQQNPNSQNTQASYSQPTQRIMRVLSPQLVRMDDGPTQPDLPSLNRTFQDNQSKTRIIPIQIEGNGGQNKSVYYHRFSHEGPPQQSKAFKVLQVITNTHDDIRLIERQHGYSDV